MLLHGVSVLLGKLCRGIVWRGVLKGAGDFHRALIMVGERCGEGLDDVLRK